MKTYCKKNGFTLIELIIVISIVALMAVVAIPAFNTFGANADLDAKADEIKSFIERSYQEGVAPQNQHNGVSIQLDGSGGVNPSLVSVNAAMLPVDCYRLMVGPGAGICTISGATKDDSIPVNSGGLNLYTFSSFEYINGVSSSMAGNLEIFVKAPGESGNIHLSSRGPENTTAQSVQFLLSRSGASYQKTIIIHKYPFSVEVR